MEQAWTSEREKKEKYFIEFSMKTASHFHPVYLFIKYVYNFLSVIHNNLSFSWYVNISIEKSGERWYGM